MIVGLGHPTRPVLWPRPGEELAPSPGRGFSHARRIYGGSTRAWPMCACRGVACMDACACKVGEIESGQAAWRQTAPVVPATGSRRIL